MDTGTDKRTLRQAQIQTQIADRLQERETMGDIGSKGENSSLSSLFFDQITLRGNALGFCLFGWLLGFCFYATLMHFGGTEAIINAFELMQFVDPREECV